MRQFPSPHDGKLKRFLARHLGARQTYFDSTELEVVCRFRVGDQQYRLNVTIGMLERVAPPHFLEMDAATRNLMEILNNVGKKKKQPKETVCSPK